MGQSSFGDGAEPHPKLEKSLFEIQWAGTAVVPDSLEAIAGCPRETGTRSLNFRLFNRMLNCCSLHISQLKDNCT